ncbi:hypothetical protein GCM10022198_00290 [Klugiella xanthotipulae]|uniref:hypothetical protein n=1 Tax=Klugiella xanthotipulae TaxID=244735 RepID=UPI001152A92A|nr:hypothetical protein [Klugiella xanthotipulae]
MKAWETKYRKRLKVGISKEQPIRWNQRLVSRTVEEFANLYSAIIGEDITFDGGLEMLMHFKNGRRDPRRGGYVVKKPDDDQDFSKVDLVWGAMFARAAGEDAIGKGVGAQTKSRMARALY